jgi:hypothetical protein
VCRGQNDDNAGITASRTPIAYPFTNSTFSGKPTIPGPHSFQATMQPLRLGDEKSSESSLFVTFCRYFSVGHTSYLLACVFGVVLAVGGWLKKSGSHL